MVGTAPHIPGCRDLSLIGERVARSLFTAHSDAVGATVTVTVFPPLSEGRTRAGFDEAAATAQRLGAHPSVLTIHDWGHADDGRPWIVTEPQPAESVDTLLTLDGPLDVERSLQVGILLAGALETAHRAGIVHGDLQPDRIVFGSQGEPLLVETGLAGFAVFPGLGALNNPVRYHSPPEVLERTEVSPPTDVYSLATTVYALLAGRAPHQKPAEVTDSNASLLLRILQMSVPPINRPDLPPGLEDALRGPLSATPSKRPQQVIEVAWLLQDVQRRAGLAVTEPVVFDLDDLRPAARDAAPAAGPAAPPAAPPPAAPPPAAPPRPAPPPPFPPVSIRGVEAPAATTPDRTPDWASETPPPAIPDWASDQPQPATPDWASETPPPAIPDWASETPPPAIPDWASETPPPAIPDWASDQPQPATPDWASETPPPAATPWSGVSDGRVGAGLWSPAGGDASPLPGGGAPGAASPPTGEPPRPAAAGAQDDGPGLWASPANGGQPPDTLWPSQWPTETPPAAEDLPPWAVAPPGDGQNGGVRAPDAPLPGGDVGDVPRGDAGPVGAAGPAGPVPGPVTDGAPPPSFAPPSRPPELDELPAWYTEPLPNRGDGGATPPAAGAAGDAGWFTAGAAPEAPPIPWPAERPMAPTPTTPGDATSRLPGAGDELRSLFGEVVGDGGDAPPAPGSPSSVAGLTADPLGPPEQRPPIDLDSLNRPLGPAPYLPPAAPRANGSAAQGSRLPSRHERAGALRSPDGPARLPRAGEADAPAQPRPARPGPRQVAGAPSASPTDSGGATVSTGPPALPVAILVVVVILLALGAIWLVVTGDDAGAPATDQDPQRTAEASAE